MRVNVGLGLHYLNSKFLSFNQNCFILWQEMSSPFLGVSFPVFCRIRNTHRGRKSFGGLCIG
jgi:hypothetical protein